MPRYYTKYHKTQPTPTDLKETQKTLRASWKNVYDLELVCVVPLFENTVSVTTRVVYTRMTGYCSYWRTK